MIEVLEVRVDIFDSHSSNWLTVLANPAQEFAGRESCFFDHHGQCFFNKKTDETVAYCIPLKKTIYIWWFSRRIHRKCRDSGCSRLESVRNCLI